MLTITLTEDEVRWIATAVTVLRRMLQGAPVQAAYTRTGLAVLHRVAEMLPPGHYLED